MVCKGCAYPETGVIKKVSPALRTGSAAIPIGTVSEDGSQDVRASLWRMEKHHGQGLICVHRAENCLSGECGWHRGLLVDVGSTFTKVLVLDQQGKVLGQSQGLTTIDTDVLDGVQSAVAQLPPGANPPYDWALASSSAAGGLKMASVGLTASLSGRAGELSVLGAGAKVVSTEYGCLDEAAVARIETASPHLALLAGGLDGGNTDALLHNAHFLSQLNSPLGFIIAGNAAAAEDAAELLAADGRDVQIVDNVFPRPGEIQITATRESVRELFLRHITKAKGLDELMEQLKTQCEPTPLAVSRAVSSVADEDGPVVLVDLGGATTDVHSLGDQRVERRAVEIPSPQVMRTVEGDLGMRWGAPGTVGAMSESSRRRVEATVSCDVVTEAARRRADPGFIPLSENDRFIDAALATAAVTVAVERHAGRVVVKHRPWGDRYQVVGKDLRPTQLLIATGGAFRHVDDPVAVVNAALNDIEGVQAPEKPRIAIDTDYALYAIGLLARMEPVLARTLAKNTLL